MISTGKKNVDRYNDNSNLNTVVHYKSLSKYKCLW